MCPFSDEDVVEESRCIFLGSVVSSVAAGRFLMRVEEMVEATLDVPKHNKAENFCFSCFKKFFPKLASYLNIE